MITIESDDEENEFCRKIKEWLDMADRIGRVSISGWLSDSACIEVKESGES